ncbi:MAG TPA: TonB-dependent receptor [Terriglobales bacterium]|nr:TonB-dependent receptor [Terriglobales bacterium]
MNRKRYGKIVLAVIVLAAVWSIPSLAQVLKGSISGSVTDPQGAVVSGAEVKATQVETGAAYITQSDNSGLFRLNLLPTGNYKLEINKQGFAARTTEGVIVLPGSDNYLGSLRLGAGSAGLANDVSATAQTLQSSQPQIINSFSDTTLNNFVGTQEYEGLDRMALFVPGLVNTRDITFSISNGVGFSTNGLRGRNNNQQIDGQNNNDNSVTGPALNLRDPNFLQQYVIISSNPGPEYGRYSGSVVNLITKTGTNAWHGNVYGDINTSSLNALSSFQAFTKETKGTNPRSRTEQFSGFTIGGPVIKNKLFIFGGFDDQIINTSTVYASGSQTPTPLGLAQLTACGAAINANSLSALKQFGPYAFPIGNPTPAPNPFTGLFSNVDIRNPTTFAIVCPAVQFGTVTRTVSTPSHIFNTIVRADWQLGSDTITARYLFNRSTFFNASDGNGAGGWLVNEPVTSNDLLLSWTHNLTAHMVNEARVSYGRLNVDFGGNDNGNPFEPDFRHIKDGLANVNIGGMLPFGTATNFPQGRIVNTWQAQDNWNYVLGKHQLKAGVNYTYQRSPNFFSPAVNGQFRFASPNTFFVTNQPNNIVLSQGTGAPELDFREDNTSLYFGDDWKVTQNLTLNLGLTWSYFTQPANLLNNISTERESNVGTAFWNPALPLSARTTPAIPTVATNFGPSIGFAYSPQWGGFLTGNGKTVIRGGYRIAYDPAFYNIYLNLASSSPASFSQTFTGAAANSKPLPAVPSGDAVRAQLAPFITHGVLDPRLNLQTTVSPNLRPDRVDSWSFGVEREITRNSAFEARYVGNRATDLFQSVNGNPFIADLKTDFPTLVPDNLTPCPAAQAFNPIAVGRVSCSDGIFQSRTNSGYSYYNGLQLEFRANNLFKQLTMRTGYTWSKTLDNTSEIFSTDTAGNTLAFSQNPVSTKGAEYSISGLDVPHTFTLLFTEQLPFFKEQHGVTGHLLGGWAVSGNYIWASGQPYTPLQVFSEARNTAAGNYYDSAFVSPFAGPDVARPFYGNRHARADSVGVFASDYCRAFLGITPANNAAFPGACNTAITAPIQLLSLNSLNAIGPSGFPGTGPGTQPGQAPVTATADQVRFIINARTAQQLFGTPFGNVPRNALRDAPQNILNFSISKQTRITERIGLELRVTAVNALNHFNFASVDTFVEDAGRAPSSNPNTSFFTGFAHPEFSNAQGRVFYFGAKITF